MPEAANLLALVDALNSATFDRDDYGHTGLSFIVGAR